ncbi:hypothetical protein, partial [Peribacillus frigoritolerans]|uniref:hypothetical protein n=1 Tax=Peribacillus frigoritolerans TaxID=450367 RepID=UPI001E301367
MYSYEYFLEKLGIVSNECDYSGVLLNNKFPVYIALDQNNHLALIVLSEDGFVEQHYCTDLVSLKLGVLCDLRVDKQILKKGKYHVLVCHTNNVQMKKDFLTLCLAFIRREDYKKIGEELFSFFNSLVQLFTSS